MYVYELEVLVFSHESERQEILAGQLCVSTNRKTLIKNRVEKVLEVGQRVIHMRLNVSVNNSRTAGERVALLVSTVLNSHSFANSEIYPEIFAASEHVGQEKAARQHLYTVVKGQLDPLMLLIHK